MSCKVNGCRYAGFHTTRAHQCGTCKGFGHGQIECGNQSRLFRLDQFLSDEMPQDKWCKFDYCESRKYHTTQSHYCKFCEMAHHNINECIYKDLDGTNEILDMYSSLNIDLVSKFQNNDNFYVTLSAGLGNMYYIRKKTGVIESLFMGSDMWGQYGPAPRINHRPLLDKFIRGITNMGDLEYFEPNNQNLNHASIHNHTHIQVQTQNQNNQETQYKIIKCPLCRNETATDKIITIKGLSETCKVCLVNEIEKCFIECNHACICGECLESL